MNSEDLLLLAFNLAILTYNIGVVIYALPVPIKTVKKWGTSLIVDGISASLLISCFTVMIYVANYLLNMFNADWNHFFSWIAGRAALIFSVFSALTYISGFLKYSYLSFINSPINIVIGYLSATLSALKALTFLGSFVLNYYRYLIILGILLYSIPFKIGKNAGSYLIAFALVFFVGLPLMPAFVEVFQASIPATEVGGIEISGYITDSSGGAVPYAVVEVFQGDELVGMILSDESGRYVLGDGLDLLPKEFNYTISVSLYGFTFLTLPRAISNELCSNSARCYVNINVPGILTTANGRLMILRPSNSLVNGVTVSNDRVVFNLYVNSTGSNKLTIVSPRSTKILSVTINNESVLCTDVEEFTWYGIPLNLCEVYFRTADNYITGEVMYKSSYVEKPNVNEKRIIVVDDLMGILTSMLSLGIAFIFSLVFIPSLYLVLLLSIAASVARVLGGRGLPIRIF